MSTVSGPTRHAAQPAPVWPELLLLALAVLLASTSLVLGAVAGVAWVAVGLAIGAAPVVVAWRRGSSEPGRHRQTGGHR